jgi:predicted Fe-Mo cluster-binding NifX family protein
MKTMRAALPVFQNRISPLLDVASHFMLFDIENGAITDRLETDTREVHEALRVQKLVTLGVTIIICGAVSGFMARIVRDQGLDLISWIQGTPEEVIQGYLKGTLQPVHPRGRRCGQGQGRRGCSGRNGSGRKKNKREEIL